MLGRSLAWPDCLSPTMTVESKQEGAAGEWENLGFNQP